MVGQKYFRRGDNRTFGRGSKYTTYNKINNNSKHLGGKIAVSGGGLRRMFLELAKLN